MKLKYELLLIRKAANKKQVQSISIIQVIVPAIKAENQRKIQIILTYAYL